MGVSMSSAGTAGFAILGRTCLASIFLFSVLTSKIPQYSKVLEEMSAVGMPFPRLLLPGAIVLLVLGSLSLILGYKARIGAFLLVLFMLPATYYFHAFWKAAPAEFVPQIIHFMKNLSLLGALLFVMAVGSGPGSLESEE
jgi:putative oxidoreductase